MRVTLGLVFLLTAGTVYAQSEGGILSGKEKAKVQRCGSEKGSLTWDAELQQNGDWSAFDGVNTFTGTSTATGKGGKNNLSFDAPSLALFISTLESRATSACGPAITVTAQQQKKFQLKVNKKATKAKVLLRYKFLGQAGGQDGKGSYAASAKGDWALIP
jgi:hypothetical protein